MAAAQFRRLLDAIDADDAAAIRKMVANEDDLGFSIMSTTDELGWPPLTIAVYRWKNDVAEALLDAGAAVDAVDPRGNTALHWAAHADNTAAVELLLGAHADMDAGNRSGLTPLHMAASKSSRGAFAALRRAGASMDAVNVMGQSITDVLDLKSGRLVSWGGERRRQSRVHRAEESTLYATLAQPSPSPHSPPPPYGGDGKSNGRQTVPRSADLKTDEAADRPYVELYFDDEDAETDAAAGELPETIQLTLPSVPQADGYNDVFGENDGTVDDESGGNYEEDAPPDRDNGNDEYISTSDGTDGDRGEYLTTSDGEDNQQTGVVGSAPALYDEVERKPKPRPPAFEPLPSNVPHAPEGYEEPESREDRVADDEMVYTPSQGTIVYNEGQQVTPVMVVSGVQYASVDKRNRRPSQDSFSHGDQSSEAQSQRHPAPHVVIEEVEVFDESYGDDGGNTNASDSAPPSTAAADDDDDDDRERAERLKLYYHDKPSSQSTEQRTENNGSEAALLDAIAALGSVDDGDAHVDANNSTGHENVPSDQPLPSDDQDEDTSAYLHSNITRDEAGDLVLKQDTGDGTFLVRSEYETDVYHLCVKYRGKATHHQIAPDYGGALLVNKRQYGDCRTLASLVRHLSRPDAPDGWRAPLTVPVPPNSTTSKGQGGATATTVPMRRPRVNDDDSRGGVLGVTTVTSAATSAARRHRLSMKLDPTNRDDDREASVYAVAKSAAPSQVNGGTLTSPATVRVVRPKGVPFGVHFDGPATRELSRAGQERVKIIRVAPETAASDAVTPYIGWHVLRLNTREGSDMVSLQDVVKAIEAGGDTMTLVLEAPPHDAQEKGGVDDDLEAYRVPQLDDGASRDVYAVARAAPQAEYEIARQEEHDSYELPQVDDTSASQDKTSRVKSPPPEARGVYAVARAVVKPQADYELAQQEEGSSYALPTLPPAVVPRTPRGGAGVGGVDTSDIEVTVLPGPAGFGLKFNGARTRAEARERAPGFFISHIKSGSPAEETIGKRVGWQVMSVNDVDMSEGSIGAEFRAVLTPNLSKLVMVLRYNPALCAAYEFDPSATRTGSVEESASPERKISKSVTSRRTAGTVTGPWGVVRVVSYAD